MTETKPTKKPVTLKVKGSPKQPISNSEAAKRLYGTTAKPATKK